MDCLIVYKSVHHGNTEKIAEAMVEVLEADLREPEEIDTGIIEDYDLIGFGSGIYHNSHHGSILEFVDEISPVRGKKVFIFSTSGMRKIPILHDFDKPLQKKLNNAGFKIVDNFSCRGYDTNGFLGYIGGINEGKPDEDDLEDAKDFALSLKESFAILKE